MMVDLYRSFAAPLTHESIFAWHKMIMSSGGPIKVVGAYRTHAEPMQVVSGAIANRKVHFEAPASTRMQEEMDAFVSWFNATGPDGQRALTALTRAGIAHLYFVSIHPFEDGNGRIGRALAEKSLAQNLGRPTLIALAYTIERSRKAYYTALERDDKDLEITQWLTYFAQTILDAQSNTIKRVDLYLARAKLYEKLRGQLNERQEKAIARMFREGIDEFKGGLSAENYISIIKNFTRHCDKGLAGLGRKRRPDQDRAAPPYALSSEHLGSTQAVTVGWVSHTSRLLTADLYGVKPASTDLPAEGGNSSGLCERNAPQLERSRRFVEVRLGTSAMV